MIYAVATNELYNALRTVADLEQHLKLGLNDISFVGTTTHIATNCPATLTLADLIQY